ncbi:MAG TPA: TonB-dependent receptor [Epsilonproteobacteria bacterium]|nr:TonB-dependent receptor [Campylobacterota bacterium]
MTIKSLSLITATLLLTTNIHAAEDIGEITVISANKTAQSISETTSNMTVITAEDIEEKGYQTVAQALEQQSGIIISRSGGMGQLTSVFTRGMNGGQTLILIDGMRMNDPSTPNGAGYLETLTTSNIEQIEILKGGSSSIWGSNASAGVINIITKQPKDGVHGSLAFSYGSYNTKSADADLSYKDEKLTAQVLASYLETDGFSSLVPRDAEADGYKNNSYNVKLGYAFNENNKLSLIYNDIKTKMQYDGYDDFGLPNPDDTNTYGDSRQKNYGAKYTFISGNYSAIFTANQNKIERNYSSTNNISSYDSINEATSNEYSLINQYMYEENKAILGLEYKDIDGLFTSDSVYFGFPNSDLRDTSYKNKSIFISNLYYINESTLLETNLRYDDFDTFENKTTYKIGLKHEHEFLKGFTTSANYYTAYDAPSTYQLVYALPSLKPVYTKGFDVTAAYKELISVTYFNNKVEDNIEDIGGFNNPSYINVDGTSKFEGLEVNGAYILETYNLHLSANYTHLFKYEKEDGTLYIRRPEDMANAAITYYTNNNMHFGIDAQYIGNRTDSDFDPITYQPLEVQTGNYTLWNLNFGAKIAEDLDLNINARNIFDKEYQSVYGYATEGASVYAKLKYSF